MRREVMTLTAQGRASAWVLMLIPIGLAIVMYGINPEYLSPLIETDIGRMFVIGAVISEIIGCIIIQRIVDIKA